MSDNQFQKLAHLAFCVTEYNCLRDGKCIVQVAKGIKLPFFTFDSNEKLLNSFKCQLITTMKN